MEGRPERIADYFVVVGVGDDSISKFEQFSSDEEVTLPDRTSVPEPITDIAVFYSKHDKLPKGYRYLSPSLFISILIHPDNPYSAYLDNHVC